MRRIAFRIALAIAVVSVASVARAAPASSTVAYASVAGGEIAGVVDDGVVAYKGIPYAAPPTGALRWRAPAPAVPWSGVRNAADYGATCLQAEIPRSIAPSSRAATMSEDCLTLNVWTPVARSGKLPVMVWLHGGGNRSGSGSVSYYDGTSFAEDGIVLVTLNYRLGIFGFFAHPALAPAAAGGERANFGLLDQIAALRWVRANIAAFGGDPHDVTLFGESAGGEDTVALASSSAADEGLFRRAIAESASDLWARWPTLAEAEAQGTRVASALGLPGDAALAQLRAVAADALERAGGEERFGPVVDGHLIPAAPQTAFARGSRVPIVIGTNDGDGSILGDVSDATAVFPTLPPDDFALVTGAYRQSGVTDTTEIARTLFRDGSFGAPARWFAARTVRAGVPAYLYRFDYIATILSTRRTAATHGSEVPFVFNTFPTLWFSAADRAVEASLHGCWVAFARTGTPGCPGLATWPPYDPRNAREMIFDAHPSVRDPGDGAVLDVLQKDLAGTPDRT
jgi:para-nitrobenzyl esterase